MLGLMQSKPLLVSALIDHAAAHHGTTEVVSHLHGGEERRSNWRTVRERARRLARALHDGGVRRGDRVATLAWNTDRHLELYFGVSGMGAVLHTVNPRLFADQVAYILDHGGAATLCFDLDFAPLVQQVAGRLPKVTRHVALCRREQLPALDLPGLCSYEDLVGQAGSELEWPPLPEDTASSLCYTSGTTGNPKGVLYSHRSTVLHSFLICTTDGLALGARDCVLLAPPMFHVNAWGVPYAAALCGARLVLPGSLLTGERLYAHLVNEGCTLSLGVPTVWFGLFQHIEQHRAGLDLSRLRLERVVIGGSAAPRALVEQFGDLGVTAIPAWGMTETSPMGTICNPLPRHRELPAPQRYDAQTRAGRAIFGVEFEIFDGQGRPLPHDGRHMGELRVRGPWVVSGYFGQPPGSAVDAQGWFSTGDVAAVDAEGYLLITDRSKDVIKSGGEWISSIDLENVAVGHPKVREAAVIGVHHSKWQERPLLIAVRKPGEALEAQELLRYMDGRVARWWLPDDVVFVDELPHTATGKLLKTRLREQFKSHRLPTDA
jgi:acyl-CoA synthetase (AMP-forming)/AMP-acid ligase II